MRSRGETLMKEAIDRWREQMARDGMGLATADQYVGDASRFATWMQGQSRGDDAEDILASDARDYRNWLLDQGRAPATVNRAMTSLRLFLDALGHQGDANPFRRVDLVEIVEQAPRALTRNEWNAVRREAERHLREDNGLALAIVCLLRYAGPRVGEVAALQLPDVHAGARQGRLIIRRGKGLKHREIPLVQEAREPLQAYLEHRRQLEEHWQQKARARGQRTPDWAAWPDGHLFLGQRGPLTERGIREIVAKIGEAAKLEESLSPHDLRHTFAKALLDPAAYGLSRVPAPITVVQDLLGHADITTTTIYTRSTHEDLARMMGEEID